MAQVLNRASRAGNEKLNSGSSLQQLRRWIYIRARRIAHAIHGMATDNPSSGPVSFLAVSAAMGLALTLTTLYSSSYAVSVNGETIGVVENREMVAQVIHEVEQQGTRMLGTQYSVEGEVDYDFALTLKSDLSDQQSIEHYFYQQLDEVSADLRKYQVLVNGTPVGIVENEGQLNNVLMQIQNQYINEDTVQVQFADEVSVEHVYGDTEVMSISDMRTALTANTTGETTYTVVRGDTFNGIAYDNDMSVSALKELNPGININQLMIGDVLNVKEVIPLVSVTTTEDVTYHEAIPCPINEVEDPKMYVGDSKVLIQGTEGEALVNAYVTYVNGKETSREVLSSTTLREPTTTTMAVGTMPKPKTASTGTYSWPIYGRITSYFGGRYIFGSYSYHSGIDISASYGAPIYAADGGTVTFSGWKGTYGKLVIITHDNGAKTYYAHNSSLLVSAGDKVYKGQQIAKAGSTGRSTGVHLHFELRINGTAVNPLSYLN